MTDIKQKSDKATDIVSDFLSIIITVIVSSFALMFAWNYVIPFLFNLPELSFLKAFALFVVSNCIFKKSTNK